MYFKYFILDKKVLTVFNLAGTTEMELITNVPMLRDLGHRT